MKQLLPAFLAAISFPAWGCFAPPPEQRTDPDELIDRTENIVLAKVIEAKTMANFYDVLYTFETARVLKGHALSRFDLSGYPAIWEGENRRFDDHGDNQFWLPHGGRSSSDTDCQIHPTFSVGGTYLVFLDKPYHVKSFEIIIRTHGDPDTRDKWLQYVESRTGR